MILSIVLPYYRNPRMLARQFLIWAIEWPNALKERVEIVIVDDGSPEPALDVISAFNPQTYGPPPLALYRVLEDRPWHQHGARNLGAHMAQAPWLLMTDMDHVIPPDTLAEVLHLIGEDGNGDRVYTFARRDAPADIPWRSDHWQTMERTLNRRGELKPHVNSFALPRSLYWRVGGYDEDYCGTYGTDRLFRDRLFAAAPEIHLSPWPLIRVDRAVVPDASTTSLPRKEGRPPGHLHRIAQAKAARGEAGTIKTLQFPWERVL